MRVSVHASLFFVVTAACGSKKTEPPALPATIKYKVAVNNPPESLYGPVKYALEIDGKEYPLNDDKYPSATIELPSSISIPKQAAAILIKGTCKTGRVPAKGKYSLGDVTDDASERAYLAKETTSGNPISVTFDVQKDAVRPFLPLMEPTRVYIDRGEAKEPVTIGGREIPTDEQIPSVTPDCDGAPIKIGDKQVGTYRAAASDFAKANPDEQGRTADQASLFIALDPTLCYVHKVIQFGKASAVDADTSTLLRGGAAHVIESGAVDYFLKPAPDKVTAAASLSSVFKDEILRAPCPAK